MTPEQRADEIEKAWVRFTPKWPGVRTLIINAIREAEAAAVARERERCAEKVRMAANGSDSLSVAARLANLADAILKGETP